MTNSQSSSSGRLYSLRKSRQILQAGYDRYKKKGKTLTPEQLSRFENDLEQLDRAILEENRENADTYARRVENFAGEHLKKNAFNYISEIILALIFALVIATVVRQMWFEPYEIPTGSMRPTFEEQDHLTVSKLAFGINCPLMTSHLYFDPKLVQRTSVFIWSGDGIPLPDTDSTYFGIFPYKKRYIKRCMGKPGDSFYFYGGKIYAVDQDGQLLTDFLDSSWMAKLEYVPFLRFEGELTSPRPNVVTFHQMHKPVGRLSLTSYKSLVGEVYNGKEWVKDNPNAAKTPHDQIETYSDILGIRNYAMARLLTKEELKQYPGIDSKSLEDGILYLELRHTPSLTYPQPVILKNGSLQLNPQTTVIPLQQHHLDALMDNMYTARFVIADGRARRYSVNDDRFSSRSPRFPGIPDGSYEFYYGKGVKIGWGGVPSALPLDHPLYSKDPANIQKLFNLGIEMDMAYAPHAGNQYNFPNRYAYFREGDLYLVGAPILKRDDPVLITFHETEEKREKDSQSSRPYIAFKDYGPPLKDGKVDIDFIKTFGMTIPDGHYLALGDNHAMSADSRIFGFVPEANLQGAPSLIIWPPSERWGAPKQKPYPIFNIPRAIVWSIALAIALIWYAIHRRNLRKPIYKKLNFK